MGEASMEIFTRTIAPILGFLLANVMFFASVPELQKYRKMNEWGSLNSHPYPIVVCNCIGWMMYGSPDLRRCPSCALDANSRASRTTALASASR